MDTYLVREATAEDRDEVLRIHDNVYFGLDYLHSYYDFFVSSQYTTPFVLLHNDKVIGYEAAQLIDDGETVATRAARLNPSYEGRGIYRQLDDFVGKWAKSKTVSRKAFTTTEQNPNVSKPSFKGAHRVLETKNILKFAVDPVELKSKYKDKQLSTDLSDIPDSAIETLMIDEEIKKYLCPYDRVVVDTVPYQLIPSNIPILRGPNGSTVVFSDVQKEAGTLTGLLSFGTLYRIKHPSLQYSLEIYGNDETSMRKHVMEHLSNIIQKADGEVLMAVFTQTHVKTEMIDDILSDYGVKRTIVLDTKTSKEAFTEQYLLEKDL